MLLSAAQVQDGMPSILGGCIDLKEPVAAGQGVVVMPNSIDACLIYHVPRVCVVCTQAMMLRS